MKNKNIIIVGIIIVIFIIIGLLTSYIDSARVRNSVEPKFTIKIVSESGDKVTYWGLGYKIIRYPSVSPNEPYKNNKGVKYGSWFMKYELPEEKNLSLEDINLQIQEYFGNETVDRTNLGYHYVDNKKDVVIVGLIDNSKSKQNEFIYNVFSNCCDLEYINSIKDNNMIEFKKTDAIITSNNN